MTATEQALLDTLLDLEAEVKRMATANPKPNLLPLFARLDELAAQLPPDSDAELRHFLQRKSYEKARMKLEGQAATRGSCGR
ncbi:MAG: hypothetical protein HY301_19620 [Verrucomicrobia bacterium]|nr:hypothetical protein [Verrucomicrobiota bacterium]